MTDNKKKEIKDYIKLYENLLFEILVGYWEKNEYADIRDIFDENYRLGVEGKRSSLKDYKNYVGQRIYEFMQDLDNRYLLALVGFLGELEYTSTFMKKDEYRDMYCEAGVFIKNLMPIAMILDSDGVSDIYGDKYTFTEIYALKLFDIYNKYHQKDNFDFTKFCKKK